MAADNAEHGTAPPVWVTEPDQTRSGLLFGVANRFEQVIRAWRLVYVAYRRIGLIDANEFELHSSGHAASSQAAVITGEIRGETAATMTAMRDGELGLPLDSVYPTELDDLRAEGRRLTEVGLFADRRTDMGRSLSALLGLMRFAFHYADVDRMATIVIGVHPHHVGFYERLIGFETIGETKTYAAVNHRLVTLLKLDMKERSSVAFVPRGLSFFVRNPVEPGTFDDRLLFTSDIVSAPPLAGYLAYRRSAH